MQAILLQQSSTLRRQKTDLFYVKFNAEFNESFFLKAIGSGQKLAKAKVVRKNADWRRLAAEG